MKHTFIIIVLLVVGLKSVAQTDSAMITNLSTEDFKNAITTDKCRIKKRIY